MVKFIKRFAQVLGALFLFISGYLAFLQISGNFHEVSAGSVYRAAQMDGQNLVKWNREHGIASVLNLRGENKGKDWYEAEVAVSKHLRIEHIDFRMSARKELTDPEVQALLEVMRNAPKPMLIHCKGGADRTGIAAALYLAGIDKTDEETAERQLSIAYGHVGIPWITETWAMDVTWERIEPWLGYSDS